MLSWLWSIYIFNLFRCFFGFSESWIWALFVSLISYFVFKVVLFHVGNWFWIQNVTQLGSRNIAVCSVRCSQGDGNGSPAKRTCLHDLYEKEGQSPWYDNLCRPVTDLLPLIASGVRGVTSNPAVIANDLLTFLLCFLNRVYCSVMCGRCFSWSKIEWEMGLEVK